MQDCHKSPSRPREQARPGGQCLASSSQKQRVMRTFGEIRDRKCWWGNHEHQHKPQINFVSFIYEPSSPSSSYLDDDAPPASSLATLSCKVLISPRKASMVAPMDRSTYLARTSTSRLTLF